MGLNIATRRTRRVLHRSTFIEPIEQRILLNGDPPTLGPEQLLPGDTTPALSVGNQTNPSLAEGPGGVSLAVWQDTRSGGHPAIYFGVGLGTMTDIYAARVRADGSVIDVTPIAISIASYNQGQPKAAWNGTNWLVAWSTERSEDRYETDIHAVRVSPDGVVLDQQPMVIGTHLPDPSSSDDIDPAGPLQVVSNGTDWFVTWWHHNPSIGGGVGTEYFATRVTADGQVPDAQGTLLRVGNQWHIEFGLAFAPVNGGQFMHGYWNDAGSVVLRRYDANMNLVPGSQRTISGEDLADVSLAGGPSGWVLAWEDRLISRVHAARVGADGEFIDTTAVLIEQGSQVDFSLGASWNGVNWSITYSDYSGSGLDHDIYSRRIEPTGPASQALGPVIKLIEAPNHQTKPRPISSGDGGLKLLYTDSASAKPGVAVAVISSTDTLLARADVSLAAPSQASAELASDGSNFLMVFNSSTAYGTRMLGQRVMPDGTAIDAEPFLIADPAIQPGGYEVVYFQGRYIVFFNANAGPDGKQIYAREVTPAGAVGPIITVAPNAPFTGFSLHDASVLNDRVILVGNANEGGIHTSLRFARIFDENLQPVTPRFRIGVGFVGSGDTEAVGGRWLAAWSWKPTHDSPRSGIAYNFIAPDGTTWHGGEGITLVSTYPDNGTPTVVSNGAEAATEAMVVWTRNRDPINPEILNEDAIVAQRIAADATRIGGVFALIDQPQAQAGVTGVFDGTNYVLSWTDQRNYPYPAQARDDIFGARVAVDGTVLDPGGFPVADSFRPEVHGDVAVAGGQIMFAYRSFRHEAPWGSYRLAARGMTATPAATLEALSQRFEFERDHAVSLEFNKPLMGVDVGDLQLQNLTTGQTISAADLNVQIIPASTSGWTYRWVYTGGDEILADGNYRATLPAGSVTDLAGRPFAGDIVVNFFFLQGDATRDGVVNLDDFNRLAQNFGQSNRTFSQADFNYDGTVNLDDFNMLAQRFGQSLPAGVSGRPGAGAGEADEDDAGTQDLLA